jgi:N-sulfoglucosamine sulfohydrolase
MPDRLNRRSLLKRSLLAGSGIAAGLTADLRGTANGAPAGERPNILMVVSEDHGLQLGCYGDPHVRTPHLDRLARDGVLFRQAYVVQAGCSPSRAAILTGLYPHQNGQIGLATHHYRMFDDNPANLVGCLKKAGYRTGVIGKIHVNPQSAFPFDLKHTRYRFSDRDYAKVAARAERFIADTDRPFFLWISVPDAHRPFYDQRDGSPKTPLAPKEVDTLDFVGVRAGRTMKLTAGYYNCMQRLDEGMGKILAALERSGKAGNTLVLFVADHGPALPRGKMTCYEGGVRVPLIMRWPGRLPKGRRADELVSSLDLMPTLLEAAGAPTPPGRPGRSLLPLLRGESRPWRTHLFTEFTVHWPQTYSPQRAVRDERYKLIHNLLPARESPVFGFYHQWGKPQVFSARAVDTLPAPWAEVYRRFRRPPEFELYDLQDDPWETRDLAGDPAHAEVLARLKARLAEWRAQSGDALRKPNLLNRLTEENDATISDGTYRRKKAWRYVDYLRP